MMMMMTVKKKKNEACVRRWEKAAYLGAGSLVLLGGGIQQG